MAKNDYLAREKEKQRIHIEIGQDLGWQQMTDMFVHVLTDYSIMGQKKLRPEEVANVVNETSKRLSYFRLAWTTDVEADAKQEELDKSLKEVVPKELFADFYHRYPCINKFRYDRKWRE